MYQPEPDGLTFWKKTMKFNEHYMFGAYIHVGRGTFVRNCFLPEGLVQDPPTPPHPLAPHPQKTKPTQNTHVDNPNMYAPPDMF